MSARLVSLVVAVVALAAVVVSVAAYFTNGAAGVVPRIGGPATLGGAPAQSFTVTGLDGAQHALTDYRGSVVLVNLWATWCAPCRSETPALEKLAVEDRARGLVVVGVDQGESSATVGRFVRSLRLTYPMWLDADQQYGRAYASVGLPTTIVVGRDGRIALGHDGELTLAEMRRIVAPLLRPE